MAADHLIEVRRASQVALSPDGKRVAFVLTTPVLEKNQYIHDIYVVRADGHGNPRQLTHNEPSRGFLSSRPKLFLAWLPSSDRLAYLSSRKEGAEIRSIEIVSGMEEVIVTEPELPVGFKFASDAFAISPDGTLLAFLAENPGGEAAVEEPTAAVEAGEDWTPRHIGSKHVSPVSSVLVRELKTGSIRILTDANFHVSSFAWAPDSRRLALEAAPDALGAHAMMQDRAMSMDIHVVDATGKLPIFTLVKEQGWDRAPTWSPDGKRIAFCSQRSWVPICSLRVIAAVERAEPKDIGGRLNDVMKADLLLNYGRGSIFWEASGDHIRVAGFQQLSQHLFRVEVAGGGVERVTTRDDLYYESFSRSADGAWMAFTAEGVATPPDIYVSSTKSFAPRRITRLNPRWDELKLPRATQVKWRSNDGRWDLQGMLLKPSNHDARKRYPTLTVIMGGPNPIQQRLNAESYYPLVPLTEQGYVVFVPSSRGRPGFGADFAHAIRDEKSYVLNPLSDVLTGIDALVNAGIADPEKLGVLGFSYGGTLAAFAVTSTDRFKAAIYGEGWPNLFKWYEYSATAMLDLQRDLWGFDNPYEPAEIRSAFEQSSIFRLSKVRTPVLVEATENGWWETDRALFRGLRHFGVPSEFYVYPRSDHYWDEPRLLQDGYRRHIAWLDYWLKGRPYPDAVKQASYDAWKQAREHD